MTLKLWKLFQVTKTLTEKWRLEASWGQLWTFLWPFCCQKRPVFWLKILRTYSTVNSSENIAENSIKTVHKLQLQLQFNQFNHFGGSFVSSTDPRLLIYQVGQSGWFAWFLYIYEISSTGLKGAFFMYYSLNKFNDKF
jgi:hypothetical protein